MQSAGEDRLSLWMRKSCFPTCDCTLVITALQGSSVQGCPCPYLFCGFAFLPAIKCPCIKSVTLCDGCFQEAGEGTDGKKSWMCKAGSTPGPDLLWLHEINPRRHLEETLGYWVLTSDLSLFEVVSNIFLPKRFKTCSGFPGDRGALEMPQGERSILKLPFRIHLWYCLLDFKLASSHFTSHLIDFGIPKVILSMQGRGTGVKQKPHAHKTLMVYCSLEHARGRAQRFWIPSQVDMCSSCAELHQPSLPGLGPLWDSECWRTFSGVPSEEKHPS